MEDMKPEKFDTREQKILFSKSIKTFNLKKNMLLIG